MSFCAALVGVTGNYRSDFVTLQRQSNWLMGEFDYTPGSNRTVLNSEMGQWHRFTDIADHYQLRFKPLRLMPRLLGNKLPNTTNGIDTGTTIEPVPDAELLNNPFSNNRVPQVRPFATSTVKSPVRPVAKVPTLAASSSVMSLPTADTAQVSNAMNSIMRPPQIGVTRPQLLFHGAPFKFNLLQQQYAAKKTKSKGFLSLFEVIKFENTKCSVAMEDIDIDIRVRALEGVCYHEFECKSLGGIPTEPCAEGVGVCCVCECDLMK